MLAEFLVISGWVFWAIIAAVVVLEITMLSNDCEDLAWPTALAIITVGGAVLFTDAFKDARLAWLIVVGSGYVALGVLWSVKKWWTFVVEKRDEARHQYETGYVNKDAPGNRTWAEYSKDKRPTAAKHKQRLITWMTLWPFSFTWWCLTWPRRAFVWLYDRLSTLYDRISDRVWAATAR